MSKLEKAVELALSANGLLAKGIIGFRPRQVQQQLARAICSSIDTKQTLMAEAGTGIGKTFAYLLPALLSGKKAVISTGSKNLQDQLFFKDVPAILSLLPQAPMVVMLKGRSNYLCHYHLQRNMVDLPSDPIVVDHLMRLRAWSSGSESGDFAEVTSVPEGALAFRLAGSTHDSCLGKRCSEYDRCYLRKARERAQEASLVVINHHLFFADMALKEGGFGEILPNFELFVFDEAHQLPDIALNHFADSVSSRVLADVSREMDKAYRTKLTDCRQLQSAGHRLQAASADLFDCLNNRGSDWRKLMQYDDVSLAIEQLQSAIKFCQTVLQTQLGRDDVLDTVFERIPILQSRLQHFIEPQNEALTVETRHNHFVLRSCPLSVAEQCRQFYQRLQGNWVFTSATLTVAGKFHHFQRQMGIDKPLSVTLDSPFDYPKQALLCVPRDLYEPHRVEVGQQLANVATELIEAADGRTFLLFTSYRMMHEVGAILARRVDQPLLVQGQGSKRTMLTKFQQLGNAVLLGTNSFWEGVDVRGRALCCVMIDKLPFASPDDPLIKARSDEAMRRGGDPFNEVLLPQAVIALKQGVGRLIRGEQDKGVMVICDPRLVNRPYGKLFLTSLPPMRRTRDLANAVACLREL
ncbi:ATP-dependent DNA helicase [Ferrimonas lipolytica]|uniref:ATP-dependent DNA helicase n=1 Tax=Ferrimonas lipolytica TaxID=2724191 RepID=A0A6H1UD29_9GAMM|nr:ATP-dependent DNA helicase [Ferrimonas lipolytica]QIZ76748.1 ATP-dependent DNA helicase [Ferrimonas lipolytica]